MAKGIFFDESGNKITKKDFMAQTKEGVKSNYFSRKEIVSQELLTDSRLDNAVGDGEIATCLFRGRTYFFKEDVAKVIAEKIRRDSAQSKLF